MKTKPQSKPIDLKDIEPHLLTSAADLLDLGADRIARDGHHKGYYWKSDDEDLDDAEVNDEYAKNHDLPCCFSGSLIVSAKTRPGATVVYANEIAAAYIGSSAIEFNDAKDTKPEDVVAMMREAATWARGWAEKWSKCASSDEWVAMLRDATPHSAPVAEEWESEQ